MKYITGQEIDKISGETGKKLKKQEKVKIFIQSDGISEYWEGGINGHFFRMPRNEFIEVPKDLAALIEKSAKVLKDKAVVDEKFSGDGVKVEI